MADSLGLVRHDLKTLNIDDFTDDLEWDIAEARLKHDYHPDVNYIDIEFRIPAMHKQMLPSSYDGLREQMLNDNYHDIRVNECSNPDFHNFMLKIPHDRIRYYDENEKVYYTYYFSKVDKLKAMPYDYEASLMISLMYPAKEYQRRRTCSDLQPQCKQCPKDLATDVTHQTGSFYEYWFSEIGSIHGQFLGYTTESVFEFDFQKSIDFGRYYILDYNSDYFKYGISNSSVWEQDIINKRYSSQDLMYFTCSDTRPIFESDVLAGITPVHPKFFGTKLGKLTLDRRNVEAYEYTTQELRDFLNKEYGGDGFSSLSTFDINTLQHRHSWSKYIYNFWSESLSNENNKKTEGFFCSWKGTQAVTDAISKMLSGFGIGVDMAASVASSSGLQYEEPNQEEHESDTEYTIMNNMLPMFNYKTVREKHPNRVMSIK